MREVIQHIIASEAEATRIVANARADSDRIVATAQQQAQALREQVSIETRVEVERLLAESGQRAAAEQQALLAKAVAGIAAQVRLDPEWLQNAVTEVVRCVSLPAHPTQEPP